MIITLKRINIATSNESVNKLNAEIVNIIPGDLHIFGSIDTVDDVDTTMFPEEFLISLNVSG